MVVGKNNNHWLPATTLVESLVALTLVATAIAAFTMLYHVLVLADSPSRDWQGHQLTRQRIHVPGSSEQQPQIHALEVKETLVDHPDFTGVQIHRVQTIDQRGRIISDQKQIIRE